jgi:hypothetical protein
MSDLMKIRLSAMLDTEIEQVKGMISNEALWAHGSETEEQAQMHTENIENLEEYKQLLIEMQEQVNKEGKINV